MIGIYPDLTKDYILERVSETEIFEYYLNIKVYLKTLIKSPLRSDRNPTCLFYYDNKGKLRLVDFAGYFKGDCFDLVGYITNTNSDSGQGFMQILDKIAFDFKLHKYSLGSKSTPTIKNIKTVTELKKETIIISYSKRNWNKNDYNYWHKYEFNKNDLDSNSVIPVQFAWVNSQLIYSYDSSDPCYCYHFSKNNIKLYFPFRQIGKVKFLMNNKFMEGIHSVRPCEYLIITKSYKDVIALRKFKHLGIDSLGLRSETIIASNKEFEFISKLSNNIFTLFDFDRVGVRMSIKMRDKFGTIPLFITNGRFKSVDYGAKDITDLIEKYNFNIVEKKVKMLINERISNV